MPTLWIIKTGDAFPEVVADHGDFDARFLAALSPLADSHPELELAVYDARYDGEPPALNDKDGLIITGSHAMVSDAEPWSEALKPWLRHVRQRNIAMLGVCYGHQLMASAFDGVSDYNPAGRESGSRHIMLTDAGRHDPLLGILPTPFVAQLTHAQSVLTAPSDASVLAANEFDANQALRYGPRQWSVQFHPEFNAAVMRAYLMRQTDAMRQQGENPEQLLHDVQETPQSASLLVRFAELMCSLNLSKRKAALEIPSRAEIRPFLPKRG
ncbi:glutamine amidotransferase [Halomonas halocynthiae]|uniref:glutamine amidotransferase n=1 Tax=Halomonas halocynthiae TaxID=176290 RepID=UPI0004085F5A|nr:glutamine amidotransferase [Halomonas halocynthiae]